MSDIFISYSSEDEDRIRPLVNALEKTGWSVFWARNIPAGKTWRQVIGSEILGCRSLVVVWTKSSVTSEWVLEEAEIGKSKRNLVPVLLDEVEPPFGFGNIQAANLVDWNGDASSPIFSHLIAAIRRLEAEAQHQAAPTMAYDVFISFKNLDEKGVPTRDAALANEVYNFLTSKGLSAFISTVTLESLGVSNYKKAIDEALDAASIMVAVGTSTENLNSEWVRYEWDGFYNDILSKKNLAERSLPISPVCVRQSFRER